MRPLTNVQAWQLIAEAAADELERALTDNDLAVQGLCDWSCRLYDSGKITRDMRNEMLNQVDLFRPSQNAFYFWSTWPGYVQSHAFGDAEERILAACFLLAMVEECDGDMWRIAALTADGEQP